MTRSRRSFRVARAISARVPVRLALMPGGILVALIAVLAALTLTSQRVAAAQASTAAHGIAMHGVPKEAAGFTHFSYVNSQAPKGGRIMIGVPGSFDSLNPLIVKGNSVAGMREYVYETLMARGLDEPFSLYGLIAQSAEMAEDRSSITFNLDPRAAFSDGKPITADDILFSGNCCATKGDPITVRTIPR